MANNQEDWSDLYDNTASVVHTPEQSQAQASSNVKEDWSDLYADTTDTLDQPDGWGMFNQLVAGINENLAIPLVQMPVDAVTGVLNGVFGMDLTHEDVSVYNMLVENGVLTTGAPQNDAEKTARRGGEVGGVALGMFAGGAGLRDQLKKQAQDVLGSLPGDIFRTVTDPGKGVGVAAAEGLSGVLGGSAGEIARQGGADETGAGMAEFAGGMVPAALVPTIGRAGRAVYNRLFSTHAVDQRAREGTAKALQSLIDPDDKEGLEKVVGLGKELGINFNLADAVEGEATAAAEKFALKNIDPAARRELAGLQQDRLRGIRQYGEDKAPGLKPGDARRPSEVVYDVADREVDVLKDGLVAERNAFDGRQQEFATSIARGDRVEIGDDIRSQVFEARQATSRRMEELADSIGLNDEGGPRLNYEEFATQARKLLDDGLFADAKAAPGILKRLSGEKFRAEVQGKFQGSEMPFSEWKALRERVSDDLIDAIAATDKPGRRTKIRKLTQLKALFDDYTGLAEGSTSGFAEQVQGWQAFRKTYFTDFIQRFEQGAAVKVKGTKGTGEYTVASERVADAFLKDVQSARQFNQLFEGDNLAQEAMHEAIIDKVSRAVMDKDGLVSETKLNNWVAKHADILEEFPDAAKVLGNRVEAASLISKQKAQLKDKAIEVSRNRVGKLLERHGADPEAVINDAILNPVLMRDLKKMTDDIGEPQALTRAVWDQVRKQEGSPDTIDPVNMIKFIDKNKASLRIAMGDEHFDNIGKMYEGLRRVLSRGRVDPGAFSPPGKTAEFKDQVGTSPFELSSRYFSIRRGVVSARSVMIDVASRFLFAQSEKQARQHYARALADPETAAALAQFARSGEVKDPKKLINNITMVMGLGPVDDIADEIGESVQEPNSDEIFTGG